MKKITRILIVFCILLVMAAALVTKYGPNFGFYVIPPTPIQYVREALSFADFGLYAQGEGWNAAKKDAIEKVANCRTYEETYPAIQEALLVAGGKHSAIRSKQTLDEYAGEQTMPVCSMDGGTFYISLPSYSMNSHESNAYTDIVLQAVKENREAITGVILDLRDNTGGDMGPMVAAVSPFLPDGTVMQFDVSGQRKDVILSKGVVTGGGSLTKVENVEKIPVPIAILQNEMTASSGEATLLCFKGLENVRFFGCDTAGYCSTNTVRRLYDGAMIQLTIGCDVDRTGRKYCEDPIVPDVYTEDPVGDAAKWISLVFFEKRKD